VQSRRLGISEADLLRSYPTLRAEDLANAWAYYRTHRDEIQQQIRENAGINVPIPLTVPEKAISQG
jgi:hypothetical protein